MYNSSGNILKRDVYTYSNTIKNQLLNIKTINSNNEVIEIKEITYQETDPFRLSTYKGNTLTWASRRLETYGSNSYRYNSELIEINSYLYKGYYYDKETSLYYCNSRYYYPEVKRFISIDDISYLDTETIGGINLYSYCYNNPVNKCDPSGNMAILVIGLLACSFIVGAGASVGINYGLSYLY